MDISKIYNCEACPQQFKTAGLLRQHRVVHSTDKRFECTTCEYKTGWRGNMQKHIRTQHNLEGNQLTEAVNLSDKRYRGGGDNGQNTSQASENGIDTTMNALLNVRNWMDQNETAASKPRNHNRKSTKTKKRSRPEEDYDDKIQEIRPLESTSSGTFSSQMDNFLDSGEAGNSGIQEDEVNDEIHPIEQKPYPIFTPILPKIRKIDNLSVKTEQNLPVIQEIRDLIPQEIPDMDPIFENQYVNAPIIQPMEKIPVAPQFTFDEDVRQIAHQISRVATSQPESHDALRQVMFETILAFGNGGFNNDVGEFFRKMADKYPKK